MGDSLSSGARTGHGGAASTSSKMDGVVADLRRGQRNGCLSGDDMMAPAGEAAAPSTSKTGLVLVLIDLTREGQRAKCLAGAKETTTPGGDEAAATVSALLQRSCLLQRKSFLGLKDIID
jgi:hypothetical protein